MYYVFIILSLAVAGELEVAGSLKVSDGIDAQGKSISNVGNAVLDSDATNLSTVRSMMGMKPTRIYSKVLSAGGSGETWQFTVPQDRFWIPALATNNGNMQLAAIADVDFEPGAYPVIFAPGMILTVTMNPNGNGLLTIHEYPISASGTEQGLDYIEP